MGFAYGVAGVYGVLLALPELAVCTFICAFWRAASATV